MLRIIARSLLSAKLSPGQHNGVTSFCGHGHVCGSNMNVSLRFDVFLFSSQRSNCTAAVRGSDRICGRLG
ncbi:unnamed protein product [Calypogeia fissa]